MDTEHVKRWQNLEIVLPSANFSSAKAAENSFEFFYSRKTLLLFMFRWKFSDFDSICFARSRNIQS